MPKSLAKGSSPIVPVKMPAQLKRRLRRVLKKGENMSELIRSCVEREIKKREIDAWGKRREK